MGLFDLFTDLSSGNYLSAFGDVFSSSGGSVGTPTAYLPQPVSGSFPVDQGGGGDVYPVMGSAPMVAQAVAAGIPRWAARFPNLWQAITKIIATTRTHVTPERLLTLLRKYGPGFLVNVIGAAAVSELMLYQATHKRRRMNVANTKALRRGLRRLKGFEKLSHRVSAQLSRTASRGRSSRRAGKCMTCRRSPCTC